MDTFRYPISFPTRKALAKFMNFELVVSLLDISAQAILAGPAGVADVAGWPPRHLLQ